MHCQAPWFESPSPEIGGLLMELVSAEGSREHAPRVWDQTRSNDNENYQNYVVPNLAPKAIEASAVLRAQPTTWRDAPPPPPDPVGVLLRYLIQRPVLALMLAYSVWLVMWTLYGMQALSD
jgi:hypothetical protein